MAFSGEVTIHQSDNSDDDNFGPSELGKKSYWDDFYSLELQNFKDHGDQGEIWFGHRTMNTIIQWISKNNSIYKETKIIDLGCGNGVFLMKLKKSGYVDLLGVDYSSAAISLALEITKEQNLTINFKIVDILDSDNLKSSGILNQKYGLCTDKGTYDAISLSAEDACKKRKIYCKVVQDLLHPDGLFILTSCNWTRDELCQHFQEGFFCEESIPMPQFQFGSKIGQTVTILIFRRNKT